MLVWPYLIQTHSNSISLHSIEQRTFTIYFLGVSFILLAHYVPLLSSFLYYYTIKGPFKARCLYNPNIIYILTVNEA